MKNQWIMMAFDRRYGNFWKNNKVDSSLVGDLEIGNMKEKKKNKNKITKQMKYDGFWNSD